MYDMDSHFLEPFLHTHGLIGSDMTGLRTSDISTCFRTRLWKNERFNANGFKPSSVSTPFESAKTRSLIL